MSTGRWLVPHDVQFKGYTWRRSCTTWPSQKRGAGKILVINYSSKEMMIWHHNDKDGRSWFYRPANAKGLGIECWHVFMSKGDYDRELLWEQQMMRRKNLFLKATKANDVSMLPRVRLQDRRLKCTHCPFYERCMYKDDETEYAQATVANDLDLLDVGGFLFCA
jgi:hypothetical protein